ncbi:MAG: histone [Caballeronia sp.]|jgi:hypothetical protein|uniref:H-NS family nucleoid-associated regulatory protein n=1 Tax=Caballeronia sp. TaxID=1931223 RepID=UPI00262E4112|nr:H-NS family nucleoid-associated regulatory protein [Caballeronia sp.]MDB5838007.1 histone [Caballeronia sp.]
MKKMAVKGNATTTGGQILDGDETALDNGRPIARHMELEMLNADIATARVLEVESARHDILQTMNDLGISLERLKDYRRFRLPPRANESKYRNPQTGAKWGGRRKTPEWLRGKVWGRFQVDPLLNVDAGLTHETQP